MESKSTNLVENRGRIFGYIQRYKNKLPSPYSKIVSISAIENLSDYQFRGIKFKLVKYKGILKGKPRKRVIFYGYSSSKKERRFTNRWLFLNYLYKNNHSNPPFLVPKPLIVFPKINLFLREGAKGKSLLGYIKNKRTKELHRALIKTGRWLSKFHGLKIEKMSSFDPIYLIEKKEFTHYLRVAKKSYSPKTYEKVKFLLSLIHAHSKKYTSKNEQTTLVHGDFQPPNIIFDEKKGNVTVIDFDWAGVGDPLSDIGDFLLQFDYHSFPLLKEEEILKLKKDFIGSYFQTRSIQNNKEFVKRVNLYQAKFAIQRAVFNTEFLLPPSSKPESDTTIKSLLEKAERCRQDEDGINLTLYPYQI